MGGRRVFVALCLVSLLAIACGGSKSKTGFDPKRADELAHAALLHLDELPGEGWKLGKDDAASPEASRGLDECANALALEDEELKLRLVRASRDFTNPAATGRLPLTIRGIVEVYPNEGQTRGFADREASLAKRDGHACNVASFRQSYPGANATQDTAIVTEPWLAATDASDVFLPGQRGTWRVEEYFWRQGNANVNLYVTGPKEAVTADLVKAALEKQRSAVVDTAAGKRQSSSPATPTGQSAATPSAAPLAPGVRIGKVADFTSYRYSMVMQDQGADVGGLLDLANKYAQFAPGGVIDTTDGVTIEIKGSYVADDKSQVTIAVNKIAVGVTTIGTQQWVTVGGRSSGPRTIPPQTQEQLSQASVILDPMMAEFQRAMGAIPCDPPAPVGGQQARRCFVSLDQATAADLSSLTKLFSTTATSEVSGKDLTQFSMQLWLTRDGNYPIKFSFEMAGKDSNAEAFKLTMNIELTETNSKTLTILPPG